jgi:hypothetical protein
MIETVALVETFETCQKRLGFVGVEPGLFLPEFEKERFGNTQNLVESGRGYVPVPFENYRQRLGSAEARKKQA